MRFNTTGLVDHSVIIKALILYKRTLQDTRDALYLHDEDSEYIETLIYDIDRNIIQLMETRAMIASTMQKEVQDDC